jgi:hypothetical protein
VDDLLIELKHKAKQCLAAVLFITLLIGASAAALTLLAAGISTLSSSRTLSIAYPGGRNPATGADASATSALSNRTQGSDGYDNRSQASLSTDESFTSDLGTGIGDSANTSNPPSSTSSVPSTNFADDINRKVEHMHSPIGEALNNGGVVLGDRIQHAFGNIVAGILQTLFLERDDSSSVTTQGNATNQTNGGGGQ